MRHYRNDLPRRLERSLITVANRGYERTVELLLKWAISSTAKLSPTPLLLAAKYGQQHFVQKLLERDDVAADSQDDDGRTPLSYAAENGHEQVVQQLLERGDVAADSQDNYGGTPLTYAAAMGRRQIVPQLLEHGVAADS
jgi:ankyrin repeat protein